MKLSEKYSRIFAGAEKTTKILRSVVTGRGSEEVVWSHGMWCSSARTAGSLTSSLGRVTFENQSQHEQMLEWEECFVSCRHMLWGSHANGRVTTGSHGRCLTEYRHTPPRPESQAGGTRWLPQPICIITGRNID
jgi:hypothetical protein